MKTIKTDLSNEGRADVLQRVRSYRGGNGINLVRPGLTLTSWRSLGYNREDRRKIEHEAFSGQLLGIIATNALELGIDIGALDAVIMLGFPITVSNFVCSPYYLPSCRIIANKVGDTIKETTSRQSGSAVQRFAGNHGCRSISN